MSVHNKKRNTGLLYEFLIKTISQALVDDDKKKSSKALKIVKTYFKPGTELYKEFRLINSIIKTTVSSEAVAASILNEAKLAARSHDLNELDKEKSLLIRSINHQLNDDHFYDQHISEYKTFATVQNLLNDWRSKSPDLSRMASYEDQIVNWLVTAKQEKSDHIVVEGSQGSNRLLMKIMMKKLGEKYDNSLTNEQKSLIKAYAFSSANDDNKTILLKIKEIKEKLINSINSYLLENSKSEKYLSDKLNEVKSNLLVDHEQVNDSIVAEYMLYIKLIDELSGGENV
ncbi:MAG: hypothetical protein EBU90_11395 [Proteobacteria bacterium]|nr:hypothetical protein [Pseudomonadota bacterium]